MIRIITIVLFSFISIVSFSQTDHSSQFHIWKSIFYEREFAAEGHNPIINFTLNTDPKSSFTKMNILVRQELPPIALRNKINHCATNYLPDRRFYQ